MPFSDMTILYTLVSSCMQLQLPGIEPFRNWKWYETCICNGTQYSSCKISKSVNVFVGLLSIGKQLQCYASEVEAFEW